jgi:hypothetical protein
MADRLPPKTGGGFWTTLSLSPPSGHGRRVFARALFAMPLLAANSARPACADQPFEDGATLLVAGAERGRLDRLAALLAAPLCRGLPAGTGLRRQLAGGDDGVTGANQFEARVAPDGRTVLLLPGAAPLAWLAGDPRARFDAARWVPVMAGWTPGIVMSRVSLGALPAGARLRIAAADPAGPDLAALLGLDLLRIEAVPSFHIDNFPAARAALAAHSVDAVFLHGENVPREAGLLAQGGLQPLFALGVPDESGGTARDPLFADVPTLTELLLGVPGGGGGLLHTAWRAAAAAAQLDFALVLPQMTPAAMVALWRRAGAGAVASPEFQPEFSEGVRATVAPAATTASLATDAPAMLELRRWLADRYGWQPS